MIRSLPRSRGYSMGYGLYVTLYFVFLFAPLTVTCVLAFNDSQFPSLPWKGFTLDWFLADLPARTGIFHDRGNLSSILTSARTAVLVSALATLVGTCAAFLFEQEEFPLKGALYFLMLAPLVIPGVICGPASGWWCWGSSRSSPPSSPLWCPPGSRSSTAPLKRPR